MPLAIRVVLCVALSLLTAFGQFTSSEILGTVLDQSGAAVVGAKVAVRNLDTNQSRSGETGPDGRFRFPQLAQGPYEIAVEKSGFASYKQGPIVLRLNQSADLPVKLNVSAVSETVSVTADAALINTTNSEVSTQFESKRISELPLANPARSVTGLALSIPGVSQLSSGQSTFTNDTNFSVNGARLRSNNFMIDGQTSNDPSVTGNQQTINNPDIVAEVRIITSQFLAEYGTAAGSQMSIVTKSGTNDLHGSGAWFFNADNLNTLSNQEVNARLTKVPHLVENQVSTTAGGRIIKDRTFYFASLQKWAIRQVGSGTTLRGAPTEAGRAVLNQFSNRPQVKALLDFLPAGLVPSQAIAPATFNVGGQTFSVPLGELTGFSTITRDNWQGTIKGDHRFSDKHIWTARYMVNDDVQAGTGQVTPQGLTTVSPTRSQSATSILNSTLSPTFFNSFQLSYQRYNSLTNASTSTSEAIPSIEVDQLGLAGINAAASRTAIGLAVNLPQFRRNNTYQVTNTTTLIRNNHTVKFGLDFSRRDIVSFFGPTSRGSLAYSTVQNLIDDVARVATINATLPGGGVIWPFKYYDYYGFFQDEWKVNRDLTLTLGFRYETPGPSLNSLLPINDRIIAAAGGNPAYRVTPIPQRDLNNFAPRLGFNYRLPKNILFGDGKSVLRGGYARSYDNNFVNLTLNVATAFPFLNSVNFISGGVATSAFTRIQDARFRGLPADPATANRTILSQNNHSAETDQFALQIQRELAQNWALTVGYIGTKGTGLFQTVDANPIVPGSNPARRVNTFLGTVRERCNCAGSWYHSMQVSLDKRLSQNFSMGMHYTWSSFIDDASELFNPNAQSDVAVAQDSFNRRGDKSRSSFDRPQRFTLNAVYEIPFLREQKGPVGRVLGGWQVSPFLTLQSGAPFTALNGADPAGRLAGISGLVGNAIRPNLTSALDLSSMKVDELFTLWNSGTRFFQQITAAQQIGNAGRNILRADGIGNIDVGFMKNTRINERINTQVRADFFNLTNARNFGTPNGLINSAAFLNQWATDAGRRRVQLSLRLTF